jgi:hypothetical protein
MTTVSLTQSDPTVTSAGLVRYAVTFSGPVTGVDASQFTLTSTGISGAAIASVAPVAGSNGAQYTVTVNTGTGDGMISLALTGAGIRDAQGNGLGPTFPPPVGPGTGATLHSVAIGDFNGDGKLDVATETGGNFFTVLQVFLGNGDGTFQPATSFSTNFRPLSLATGDVNGDGKLDLVAGTGAGAPTLADVEVFLGNGNGTFQTHIITAPGSFVQSLAIGDLTGDGKPDLVVPGAVLPGNGNGTFQPGVGFATGTGPAAVAIGDLNGDGKLDVVTSNVGSNDVSVVLGNGNGTFQPMAAFAVGAFPDFVAIGDLNGDGKPDIVTANLNSNNVSVLLGNGNGTFQPSDYLCNWEHSSIRRDRRSQQGRQARSRYCDFE